MAYSNDELQKRINMARHARDTKSVEILTGMLVAQGGDAAIAAGEIPENETRLQKITRLRDDALLVHDHDSANILGLEISKLAAEGEQLTPPDSGDDDPVDDVDGEAAEDIDQTPAEEADETPADDGEAINDGEATDAARKLIAKHGLDIAEIPGKDGGRVGVPQVEAYLRLTNG